MTRSLAELRQYLAGEWLFDNDFKDTSGNGNDAVPNDIEWASTLRGLKPRFNGSSSGINCGNDSSLNVTTEATLSCWIKLGNGVGTYRRLIDKNYLSYSLALWANNKVNLNVVGFDGVNGKYSITTITDTSWHHVAATFSSGVWAIYIDGTLDNSGADTGTIAISTNDLHIGELFSGGQSMNGKMDGVCVHSVALSAPEMLALYNATSGEYGVRIAEFSYQHDPAAVIGITDDTVMQIGGKLAGDAVDTISDRALSNDATIHGAMPTGDGFLAGGRRFVAANSNYLDCGNGSSLQSITATIEFLIKRNNSDNFEYVFDSRAGGGSGYISLPQSETINVSSGVVYVNGVQTTTVPSGIFNYIHIRNISIDALTSFLIGKRVNDTEHLDGILNSVLINTNGFNAPLNFNTLAALPFWSINYRDFPDNVTTYTDRFPHSSTVIASGAFKVDDDKIQCASAGTLTYSASNEFDGQEYITVTIAGTEYSGTGTITQGNTTVSVAQGSNKITVEMGTGDTIDKIKIQFRATV